MGFFDRFRRPAVVRDDYNDRPISNRPLDDHTYTERVVDDRTAPHDRVVQTHNESGWLWLLLIPLLLLLGLGAYSYLANTNPNATNQPNFLTRLFNTVSPTPSSTSSGGLQFGVGGAPATPTPTSTSSSGSSVSVTPTVTPVSSVKGTSTRQLPGEAPSTGRGGE